MLPAVPIMFLRIRSDYRPNERLDNYEADGIDNDVEEELDEDELFAARAAADRELDERQRRAGGLLPRALEGEI